MINSIFFEPLAALILVSVLCAIFGSFILWKKLSYYGDGLSHSILLGFVFGAIFKINNYIALLIFSLLFTVIKTIMLRNKLFYKDTIIAVTSYFCISVSFLLNDVFKKNINFNNFIFGDLLLINQHDLAIIAIITTLTIVYFIFSYKINLIISINKDLAIISGVNVALHEFIFLFLLSFTIALLTNIVGVLLVTALLILPSAVSRIFSKTPLQMIIFTLIFSIFINCLSFFIAKEFDINIGSVSISILSFLFIILVNFKKNYA